MTRKTETENTEKGVKSAGIPAVAYTVPPSLFYRDVLEGDPKVA